MSQSSPSTPMIWWKTEEQRLHVRISGQRDCQLFATLSHWKDSKTRLRRGPCHPDTQAHNHLWHKWCCQQSQLPVHISRSEDSPPPPRSKIECHHQCIWPPGNYLIGHIRLLYWALMLLLSSIYLVGRPTRWSLLFTFGFLIWSSSW